MVAALLVVVTLLLAANLVVTLLGRAESTKVLRN
jgi:hypothetical protein